MKPLSDRKLQSYKLAELVCRELRYQLASNAGNIDLVDVSDFLVDWMEPTGKIKYVRPTNRSKSKRRREREARELTNEV